MSRGEFYSELKAAHHPERMAELRAGGPVRPVELQLILSDLCNQNCHWCAYRAPDGLSSEGFGVVQTDGTVNHNPNRMIATAKAREILSDAAAIGYRSVIFTGGGEPAVHPDHLALFDYALALGLKCALNTNGALFRRGWEHVIPRFAYARVSVDAGTAEEYAATRAVKPSVYDRVLENLALLVRACEPTGCVVGAGYVVTPDNWPNLVRGIRALKATGVRYVRIASMQSTAFEGAYTPAQWQAALGAIAEAKALQDDGFQIADLFASAMGEKAAAPSCHFQKLVTYVGADLSIARCCYTAYTALGTVASLKDQSLRSWLANPATHEDYRTFDARRCATCPLEGKNRVLRYLATTPAHVEFL